MASETLTVTALDAQTLRDRMDKHEDLTVIDVRSAAEFETMHIRGSYNVPLNLLDEHAEQVAARLDRHVVLVCRSGPRAAQARQRLAAVGADRVHVLDGGINAYARSHGNGEGDADGSLVRGRAHWSLERQVRLVAGALVLAGLAAGLRTPRARLLSAGVGGGLAVSALTDTCTMGRVLSALPYNRGPRDRTPAEVLAQLPTGAAARPEPSSTE